MVNGIALIIAREQIAFLMNEHEEFARPTFVHSPKCIKLLRDKGFQNDLDLIKSITESEFETLLAKSQINWRPLNDFYRTIEYEILMIFENKKARIY